MSALCLSEATGGNEGRHKIGHLPRQLSNRGLQNAPAARALLQLINVCFFPLFEGEVRLDPPGLNFLRPLIRWMVSNYRGKIHDSARTAPDNFDYD